MVSLFEQIKLEQEPLASRMRPRNLDEYIGQDHIIGKGRLLRRAIAADQLTSVIFYGPPGSGKTTLARVIANHTKSNFITLNAVLTGVSDIREAIKQADDFKNLYQRRTILFVDEVHRWNKSQQDALLPWVENGTIILIGATTENPFFEVNKALVSRSRVFQLKALTKEDLHKAANQAITDIERGYGKWKVEFEDGALEHLIETANGDARSLLNALELAVETTPEKWNPKGNPPEPEPGSTIFISKETAEESIQKKVVLYDKDGDYHYDIISAFIKSLRGRDPDAAMYWLARMVSAGEDPHFIFRRMLISSCEDTGLSDPNAITVVNACATAFDRVGLPEGRYFLAHAALYLATAPKSNSSMAFFDALSAVEKEDAQVPNHLKDSSRDAEGFGHGEGYLYPHAYKDHWVAQQYLPDALMGKVFYTPSDQGYEGKIRNEVLSRRELQIAAILEKENTQEKENRSEFGESESADWWIKEHFKSSGKKSEENLTFSPKDPKKEVALDRADRFWRQRLDSNRAEFLLSIRDTMTSMADLKRHHRCLIWNADNALLLWEIARKTPEGVTCGVCRTEKGKEILEQYGRTLSSLDRPILNFRGQSISQDFLTQKDFYNVLVNFQYAGTVFDRIFFTDPFASESSIIALSESLAGVLSPQKNFYEEDYGEKDDEDENFQYESPLAKDWKVIISQKIPCHGQRISSLVKKQILGDERAKNLSGILEKMNEAEEEFFEDRENPLFSWDGVFIANAFRKKGLSVKAESKILTEKKKISLQEIEKWFSSEDSSYTKKMKEAIGEENLLKIKNLLLASAEKTIFDWNSEFTFLTICKSQ